MDALLRNQFHICICLFVLIYWARHNRNYRDNLKGVYIKIGQMRYCLYINRLLLRSRKEEKIFPVKRLENWHVLSSEEWVKFWWAKIENWKEIEAIWIEASIWRSIDHAPWTLSSLLLLALTVYEWEVVKDEGSGSQIIEDIDSRPKNRQTEELKIFEQKNDMILFTP